MQKPASPRRSSCPAALLISITAALLAGGCSHDTFDSSNERFPAQRLIEHRQPVKAPVHKAFADGKQVAAPKAIACKTTDLSAGDVAGSRDQPRPVPQAQKIEPAPVQEAHVRPPSVEPRASAAGRRSGAEAPAGTDRPLASAKPLSIGTVIEQAELNLRIGNIAVHNPPIPQ